MSQGRIRAKRLDFTQISNTLIFDSNLSNHAKVLGCMIQAKITIPDFVLYKTTLIKLFGKQEDTFNKYWRELKNNGYLIQFKEMVTKDYIKENFEDKGIVEEKWPKVGTYYYEYEFLDVPNIQYAKEQNAKNNQFEKINDERKNTESLDKSNKNTKGKTKKSTVGKKHTVEEPHSGEVPQYNYTELSNTDLNNIDKKQQQHTEPIEKVVVEIDSELLEIYTEAFGEQPKTITIRAINRYVKLLDLDSVLFAIEEAGTRGKKWDYSLGMLKIWVAQGCKDFDGVVKYNESYSNSDFKPI